MHFLLYSKEKALLPTRQFHFCILKASRCTANGGLVTSTIVSTTHSGDSDPKYILLRQSTKTYILTVSRISPDNRHTQPTRCHTPIPPLNLPLQPPPYASNLPSRNLPQRYSSLTAPRRLFLRSVNDINLSSNCNSHDSEPLSRRRSQTSARSQRAGTGLWYR
jgi:hypothetical protein